jgi:hypothetical protein
MGMVRKQILITADQNRRLRQRATVAGVAEAEIVRHGIELALAADRAAEDDWRATLERAIGGGALDEHFAGRVAGNKKAQARAWHKRLERTRRLLAGD